MGLSVNHGPFPCPNCSRGVYGTPSVARSAGTRRMSTSIRPVGTGRHPASYVCEWCGWSMTGGGAPQGDNKTPRPGRP